MPNLCIYCVWSGTVYDYTACVRMEIALKTRQRARGVEAYPFHMLQKNQYIRAALAIFAGVGFNLYKRTVTISDILFTNTHTHIHT